MTAETIHTCSYECERPECIRAQRDELRVRLEALTAAQRPAGDGCHCGTCTCNPNMTPAVRFDLSPVQTEGAIREHLIRLGWTPPAAEPKTLPVPTRVYLIDKAAVIAGHPQRGWDEDGPDAHNCDDMGCSTFGRHVLARVPFTDERALSQQPEARAQGGGEVVAYSEKFRASGDWSRYPIGTRAYDIQGGYWERVANGWKWCTGSTFPTPGGDAFYVAVPVRVPAPPSAPVGVKTLSEFMAEQEALHPGIHDKVQAATDELRASLAQQPAAARGDVRGLVAKLAAHVRPTCSELWDEAQAFLAAEAQAAEARGVVDGWRLVVRYGEYDSEPGVWAEKDGSLVWIAALAQQPAAPNGAVNVIGMPEFDGLLDHIYEYGTAAEGVIEKANAFARAVIARYAPQQPAAVDGAYPTPRNRAEAVALARLALAYLGVIDAHIDAAVARCETDLAAQHQEPTT